MLSAAKHLCAQPDRPFPFAALRASAHALRATWCDCANDQELFFTIEPCLNKLIRHTDGRSRDIMSFNNLIRASEQPPRADTSALATINRALQSVAGVFLESSLWRLGVGHYLSPDRITHSNVFISIITLLPNNAPSLHSHPIPLHRLPRSPFLPAPENTSWLPAPSAALQAKAPQVPG